MTQTQEQYPTAYASLAEYYGPRFEALKVTQQDALTEDVVEMMIVENLTSRKAVQTLDSRIWNKLESYASTLVAGR